MAAGLMTMATAVIGGPAPAVAAGDQLVEIEAPIVIETVDPAIDVDDPVLVARMADVHESVAPVAGEPGAPAARSAAHVASSTSGGMSAAFFGDPPSSVMTVATQAVDDWDRALDIAPSVPVVVGLVWTDLGNPGLLGSAGPQALYTGGGLPTASSYPVALANRLLGSDRNGGNVEVVVSLNSTANWYVGATGAPGSGQVDLYSVVLHEIAHGLGFIGSASNSLATGGHAAGLSTPPFVYDRQVTYNGTSLPQVADPNAHLTTGALFINANDGMSNKVWAPPGWQEGSSFSHFDDGTYPIGHCGALMTPTLAPTETARALDAALLGVMANIGWPLDPPPAPRALSVTGGLNPTVSWDAAYCPPSTTYTVQRSSDGTNWTTVGTTASTSLATAVSHGVHQFRVRANDFRGAGAFGYTVPTGFSSGFVRPVALDGQLSRLYQAYFLRQPDASGFGYWQGQRAAGVALATVSATFAASGEFQATYGSLSDGQFVDLAYQNVLNRAADGGGKAHWLAVLAGGASRGEVMIGFSESAEFVAKTGTTAPTTIQQAEVYRLYVAFFQRQPDQAGFGYWVGVRASGTSLRDIANLFASSAEFVTTYGSLTDARFVELVYSNVLGRVADAGGSGHWQAQLAAGLSRGQMMIGFSQSGELVLATGTLI
jgi:hypothetical protein